MKNVLKNKEKVYTRLNVKTKYYAVIVALVLILPFLFRLNSPLPGDENYLIDRLSHTISENRNLYDDLSFGGMPITRPLGTILLFSLFNRFRDIAFVLLPIICGILSVILFVKILNKLNISKDIIFVSFFILVLSNAFLYNFITGFFLFVFYLIYKKEKRTLFIYLLSVLITGFTAFFWQIRSYGFPSLAFNNFAAFLQNILTEFNGFGVGLPIFILGLIGLKKLWEKKYDNIISYLFLIFLFVLTYLNTRLVIYLSFLLSYLAAVGLIHIYNIKWESLDTKKITIFIMILSILFSGFSYIVKFKAISPTEEMNDALLYLKENTDEESVIFSHYNNGMLISSIAFRKNFIDKSFTYIPGIKKRLNDQENLFYSRNLKRSSSILDRYDVQYILITNDMKHGLVWNDENEGLLFVLKFSENFIKVYDKNDIEIWRYFPE